MLEGSGTTLISLFKNIIYMHQWLRLKICLKKISLPLSLSFSRESWLLGSVEPTCLLHLKVPEGSP